MRDGRAGWDEMAATYDRTRALPGDGERAVPLAVAAHLRAVGATRVLDLGCGTGRFTLPLAREGVRVVGADRSPEMLAVLAAKRGDVPVRVVRCDATALPFRRAFDAVLFSHVLHLVGDLGAFAAELRRVLLPSAHLVVVDTGSGPRETELRVLSIVMPLLEPAWTPWPTGEDSKDRRHFRDLLGRLAAAEGEVVPCGTFAATTSLRECLAELRARRWWSLRLHDEAAVAAAVSEAERRLVAEGADLDAREDAPVVVRLLTARMREPGDVRHL